MIFISDLQTLHTNKRTQACKIKIKCPREEAKDHIPIRTWRVAEFASSHAITSNIQRNQNNEVSNITLV